MSNASTDPTFQSTGNLNVALKTLWDISSYSSSVASAGMPVSFNALTYGPPNEPPPPWYQGQGGQYLAMQTAAAQGFGAMLPSQGWMYQAGLCQLFNVNDMSANSVATGKTYSFSVGFGGFIQLFFMITGTAGGSTVLPGFGLWSLPTNPGAWTYITPTNFNDEWKIGLRSPWSFSPVWLSVEYVGPKNYLTGRGEEARLIFTCSGDAITQWIQSTGTDQPFARPSVQDTIQHIDERSAPYTVHRGEGIPVLANREV